MGPEGEDPGSQLGPADTARCWQALRYTAPKATSTTPALRGPQGQVATTISEKEALIREVVFPPAPRGSPQEDLPQGTWHTQLREEIIPAASMELGCPPGGGIGQTMLSARNPSPDMEDSKGDLVAEAKQTRLHPGKGI
ncbi:hypothetical protein VTN00DRAFT_5194 [Thermoascus crustaceus]|uniref:uncharacterized protein n=1 Tax=Thermoascus crustaceus TaxID=5088 RepID=UPI003742E987